MTIEQLKKRCNDEFQAKKKGKWIASIVFMVLGFLDLANNLINIIVVLAQGMQFVVNPMPIIICLAFFGISGTLTNERDKVIKKYKKSGEYQNLPVEYPCSLLYPGETWPFSQTNMQPQNNIRNNAPTAPVAPASAPVAPASAPVAPAPAPVAPAPAPVAPAAEPVATAAKPESIVITGEKCGQTMLIPSGSGAVKITCPKCCSDIIHTYDN